MRWAPRLSSPKADATAVGYTKWNLANLPRYRQTPWRESLAFQRRVKSEDVDALLVFLHAARSVGSAAATTLKIRANRFWTRTPDHLVRSSMHYRNRDFGNCKLLNINTFARGMPVANRPKSTTEHNEARPTHAKTPHDLLAKALNTLMQAIP